MNLFQFPPKKKSISSFNNDNYIKKTRNINQLKFNDIDSKTKQILSIKQNSETNNIMKKIEEKQINNKIPEDIE